jgi:YesN/AraC family two-component response regulator
MQYLLLVSNSLPEITTTCDFSCAGGYSTGDQIASPDSLELTLVTAGEWNVSMMGYSYQTVPNQIMVYPPMTCRKAMAIGNEIHHHSTIYMKNIVYFRVLSENQLAEQTQIFNEQNAFDVSDYRLILPMAIDCTENPAWVRIFFDIISQNSTGSIYAKLKTSGMLLSFLLEISESCMMHSNETEAGLLSNASSIAKKMIIYINSNFDQIKYIDQIAKAMNYNSSYLGTVFKKFTGSTVVEYINKLRVEKAKEIIKSSDESFNKVAVSVGVDNIYYFYRIFKKLTGMTMGEYSRMLYRNAGRVDNNENYISK